MALTEKQKKWRNAWDSKNMTVLGCKVRKEKAEDFKAACASKNTSVNAVFLSAIDRFMADSSAENHNGTTVSKEHGSTVQPTSRAAATLEGMRHPFIVDLSDWLSASCRDRYRKTHRDPVPYVLQALEDYARGVTEDNSFLILFAGSDADGFTFEQLKAAARSSGMDLRNWIIEAIKSKI